MPTGPLGWSCRMHQEPGCEFASTAQGLASVEVDSGAWIDLTLPRHIGGVAPFCPHLSLLLLPGGGFGGRIGGWEVVVVCALGWGGRGGCRGVAGLGVRASC